MANLAGIASTYGFWVMGGTIALLALFWLLRGRIRIEKGWAGFNIVRFTAIERLAHWMLALSFVVLALSGLGMRHGASLPWPPPGFQSVSDFAVTSAGLHLFAGMTFAAGLILALILWVHHSLPHWRDAVWIAKGGGMLVRRVHPAAHKFNAGQKLLFWLTTIAGVLLTISGLAMAFPSLIVALLDEPLLALLRLFGVEMTASPALHLAMSHGALSLVLICAAIVHIYMRTVGIQGAASAMISGEVDANWARQHHSLWAETEVKRIEERTEADAAADTAAARTP